MLCYQLCYYIISGKAHLECKRLVEDWAAAVVLRGGTVAFLVIAQLDVGGGERPASIGTRQ
jgi:hypothetical protein